jgi:hypothetical protein
MFFGFFGFSCCCTPRRFPWSRIDCWIFRLFLLLYSPTLSLAGNNGESPPLLLPPRNVRAQLRLLGSVRGWEKQSNVAITECYFGFFGFSCCCSPRRFPWSRIVCWIFRLFLLLYFSTLSLAENSLFHAHLTRLPSHFQGRHSHIQLPHGHLLRRHSRLQHRHGYLPLHSGDLAAKPLAAVFAADFEVATRSSSDEFHVLAACITNVLWPRRGTGPCPMWLPWWTSLAPGRR